MPTDSATARAPLLRDRAGGIVATATVLALLYLGRDVLVPITLAGILSLLVAPLVRALRRLRLGQTWSVLAAVLALTVAFGAAGIVIGTQLVRMTTSLPSYEQTIRHKLETLNDMTVGRLNFLSGQARRLIDLDPAVRPSAAAPSAPAVPAATQPTVAIPVEIHDSAPSAFTIAQRVLTSVWVPLETTGIVLVVLVFLLLEHEAVRDRFIRIAGGSDIRATTLALNDAGERLSRFFVSQFLVNPGVGIAVGAGLMIVGLPHALLWGGLSAVLRFVPYVGIWIGALFSTLLAAAVDPGWTLAIMSLSLFIVVELVAGQLIEPQLYGHTTGMSPLSVVIAAIFWSWLWGPIGLIVSTPLTLCLVVAGRHIQGLSLLDVLLGDNQALTMSQRFYQRALSADSQEILASAREFLKRQSFAAYCDLVLMPALSLARLDLLTGAIDPEQQIRVRDVMVSVIAALGGGRVGRAGRRQPRGSVLDRSTAGRRLREQREAQAGPFQGPLSVPPGSVMLCIGLGSFSDDLAAELLVRILRDQSIDGRHLSVEDLSGPPPPKASSASIGLVFLVSAFPSEERARGEAVAETARQRFGAVPIVSVFMPGMSLQPGAALDSIRSADRAATSFGHAVQICLSMQQNPGGPHPITEQAR